LFEQFASVAAYKLNHMTYLHSHFATGVVFEKLHTLMKILGSECVTGEAT